MLHFTKKRYGTEEYCHCDGDEVVDIRKYRKVREGNISARFMQAMLDGGNSGVQMGLTIIPGVLIICTLYLTRADRKRQCLAGALLFLFELTAPLAFVLVWFYNGQRGACNPLQKKPFTGSTRCTCWC